MGIQLPRWKGATEPPSQSGTDPQYSAQCLGPALIVLDEDPSPPERATAVPNLRPLSVAQKRLDGSRWHLLEVGNVLDRYLAPRKWAQHSRLFGPFLFWPNEWMDQDDTRYRGIGLGQGLIVLDWDPSAPCLSQKGSHSTTQFSAHVYCDQSVAHLGNCWALVILWNLMLLRKSLIPCGTWIFSRCFTGRDMNEIMSVVKTSRHSDWNIITEYKPQQRRWRTTNSKKWASNSAQMIQHKIHETFAFQDKHCLFCGDAL